MLLAVISAFYAIYHGPRGLRAIAARIHGLASALADGLRTIGLVPTHEHFFDTLRVPISGIEAERLRQRSEEIGYNLRYYQSSDVVGITLGEDTEPEDIEALLRVFAEVAEQKDPGFERLGKDRIPRSLVRRSDYLQHPYF